MTALIDALVRICADNPDNTATNTKGYVMRQNGLVHTLQECERTSAQLLHRSKGFQELFQELKNSPFVHAQRQLARNIVG